MSARWRCALFAATVAGVFPTCGGDTSNLSEDHGCEVTATTPVAWTAATEWGTPEQLFARFAGTCQAPFAWDGSSWNGTLAFAPLSGKDTLTAAVDLDTTTARRKDQQAKPSGGSGLRPMCGSFLEVDASVSLVLSSGTVVARQKVALASASAQAPRLISLNLPEAEFGNWIAVQKSAPSMTVGMQIQLGALGESCAGSIRLRTELKSGNSASGFSGPLATWSDTGCAEGKTAVPLNAPYQGVDLGDAVARAFSQAAIPGQWAPAGEATALILNATPNGMACAEPLGEFKVVTIPVAITASTADGRIQGLAGSGTIRATVAAAGGAQLELNLSVPQPCTSITTRLSDTSINCAVTERIEIQVHLNRYASQATPDGGSLTIYQYQRSSSPGHGAEKVDTLELAL